MKFKKRTKLLNSIKAFSKKSSRWTSWKTKWRSKICQSQTILISIAWIWTLKLLPKWRKVIFGTTWSRSSLFIWGSARVWRLMSWSHSIRNMKSLSSPWELTCISSLKKFISGCYNWQECMKIIRFRNRKRKSKISSLFVLTKKKSSRMKSIWQWSNSSEITPTKKWFRSVGKFSPPSPVAWFLVMISSIKYSIICILLLIIILKQCTKNGLDSASRDWLSWQTINSKKIFLPVTLNRNALRFGKRFLFMFTWKTGTGVWFMWNLTLQLGTSRREY